MSAWSIVLCLSSLLLVSAIALVTADYGVGLVREGWPTSFWGYFLWAGCAKMAFYWSAYWLKTPEERASVWTP